MTKDELNVTHKTGHTLRDTTDEALDKLDELPPPINTKSPAMKIYS
jgi:hypothetical protein